jgi:hypothetical protein
MSKVAIKGANTGTATFTIESPATNTDRTLVLPDAAGTIVTNTATQTLTNKTIEGGALTLATAVTASGTSVDFTSIPSWVKRITVMFDGVSTNGTSNILIQLGNAGGVETTGYAGNTFNTFDGGTINVGVWSAGAVVHVASTGATYQGSVGATIFSGNSWVFSGSVSPSLTNSNNRMSILSGSKTLSDILDRIRITTVNGTDTFDAGSFNILYEG